MVAVLAAALLAAPALAHQTILEKSDVSGIDHALVLPHPDEASSIYGTLKAAGEVDFIKLDVTASRTIDVDLMVPREKNFVDFYPVFALVGPGLPAPEMALPFKLPMGDGAVVVSGKPVTPRPSAFDYTTLSGFYKGLPKLSRTVETPGTYYIAVWAPGCDFGDYLVSLGGHNDVSARSLIDSYRVAAMVKAGEWGNTRGDTCGVSLLDHARPALEQLTEQSRCELTVVPGIVNSSGLNPTDSTRLNMFGLKCG